jgi:hypothetical protein
VKSLLEELEAQGWRIKDSKKGWMVYPPDVSKNPVAIHKTPSDHRAWNNLMSELKRAGFIQ